MPTLNIELEKAIVPESSVKWSIRECFVTCLIVVWRMLVIETVRNQKFSLVAMRMRSCAQLSERTTKDNIFQSMDGSGTNIICPTD
jgi:hypothetical protein